MNILNSILLVLHVSGGMTALFSGLIPMIARKGSKTHVIGGKIYLWAMWVAFFSALPLAMIKMNLFLGAVAVFTGYLIYTGNRAAQRKSPVPSSTTDLIVMWGTMLVGATMIVTSVFLAFGTERGWSMGVVLAVFGIACLVMTIQDRRYTLNPDGFSKKSWVIVHIGRFGGGYIATLTAFLVTNVTFVSGLLLWLAPGIIGGMILKRTSRYWRIKMNIN